MKRRLILFISLNLFLISAIAQEKLVADKEKSQLQWLGEKVTGQHTGTVKLKSGWINMKENKIVSGEFNIDMTTIEESDDNAKFEGHMRSDDFFAVEKYPEAKLVITESTPFEKGTATVKGNLTIKSFTNPVEFKTAIQKKDDGVWFFSNITIDRTKYDIRYGSGSFFEDLGDKTIYDDFKLKVNLLTKKQ